MHIFKAQNRLEARDNNHRRTTFFVLLSSVEMQNQSSHKLRNYQNVTQNANARGNEKEQCRVTPKSECCVRPERLISYQIAFFSPQIYSNSMRNPKHEVKYHNTYKTCDIESHCKQSFRFEWEND